MRNVVDHVRSQRVLLIMSCIKWHVLIGGGVIAGRSHDAEPSAGSMQEEFTPI